MDFESIFGKIVDGITGAGKWMSENKEAANLLGSVAVAGGSYLAQKEMAKDALKQQHALMEQQDRLKQKYSAVPKDVDLSYILVFDESPNLANGGILTELKNRKGGA